MNPGLHSCATPPLLLLCLVEFLLLPQSKRPSEMGLPTPLQTSRRPSWLQPIGPLLITNTFMLNSKQIYCSEDPAKAHFIGSLITVAATRRMLRRTSGSLSCPSLSETTKKQSGTLQTQSPTHTVQVPLLGGDAKNGISAVRTLLRPQHLQSRLQRCQSTIFLGAEQLLYIPVRF